MNTMPPAPGPASFVKKHSVLLKMGGVLLLVLLLLIPLAMIRSVLSERMARRDEAAFEITSTWGGAQVVIGPVLVVPYTYTAIIWKEQVVNGKSERLQVKEPRTANAFFLPDELAVEGNVEPARLHRGIYEAVVFKGRLSVSGRFLPPDFSELGMAAEDAQLENAMITLAVSDLRGTAEMLKINMGGRAFEFAPGCRLSGYSSGITARVPGIFGGETNLDFSFDLDIKGSGGLSFAPVGRQNRLKLASAWPDPSFRGAFLPGERRVGADGFEAAWSMSWYGRGYPQQATDLGKTEAFDLCEISKSLFGVEFLSLIDAYRMMERAIKYGVLFIALIFTAFFLFEVLADLRIHAMQYTLVGAGLCLFYLGVLSLSEFIRFVCAYWIGAAAAALLIVLYSAKALKSGLRALILAAALLAIYAYLYVALRLQDYSLLFGTAGLFAALGIVMYATRNVNWHERN